MKVLLMYPDRDFVLQEDFSREREELVEDIGLNVVFEAMARGDEFLFKVARCALLNIEGDKDTIIYRQEILRDCLNNPQLPKRLYSLTQEFMERRQKQWFWLSPRYASPGSVLSGARGILRSSLDLFKELREIAERGIEVTSSRGFTRFFQMVLKEMDDTYLSLIKEHLAVLEFEDGTLLKGCLGPCNIPRGYALVLPKGRKHRWLDKLKIFPSSQGFSFTLHPRDHNGARALGEIKDRGISSVALAVAKAASHVEKFFKALKREMAFYIGALNLYESLREEGACICMPVVSEDVLEYSARHLYNVALLLVKKKEVVANDVDASAKNPVIITGTNQGGKTTFLQAVALAQIMMQAGMFVGARSFISHPAKGIFTHFKREEDRTFESGKFEEELKRMSAIIDKIRPGAMLFLNESFGATNEREGSHIARDIVLALVERGIRIFYVTHLYEFASLFYEKYRDTTLFLRAERLSDGTRTFKLVESRPLQTSYGQDLYKKIFKDLF